MTLKDHTIFLIDLYRGKRNTFYNEHTTCSKLGYEIQKSVACEQILLLDNVLSHLEAHLELINETKEK